MKIVHLTDLHFETPPRVSELWGKRLLGSVNLYVLGRHKKFDPAVQAAAIEATLAEAPDAVVFTGDLTAQATDAEFSMARDAMAPILDRFPTFMIAGNHDTYVREPEPGLRMRELFKPWMGAESPHLQLHEEVAFLSIETCRAHPLSSGFANPDQFAKAHELLKQVGDRFVFLCIHYPLRGRGGEPYGPSTRALANAPALEAFLMDQDQIDCVLHGHEHHGFQTEVASGKGPITILNPGSTGYAHDSNRDRRAHLNIYEVGKGGITELRRLRFHDGRFEPEPGGAYATGR
jgi:3',5'-cyclic AMP phosphodiesterase CpdA